MDLDLFCKIARQPGMMNNDTLEELRKVTEAFPSFHAAWMLYLKNLYILNDLRFDETLKKAAPLIPDRKQLFRYIHHEIIQSDEAGELKNEKLPMQNYMLKNVENPTRGNKLIDRFLSGTKGTRTVINPAVSTPPPTPDNKIIEKSLAEPDDMVTETLANIYMQQKKYDKALEAFQKLSLKYPEKNSYFATRIEEITKLKNN